MQPDSHASHSWSQLVTLGHIWPHHEQSMAFADYEDMFSEVGMAYLASL